MSSSEQKRKVDRVHTLYKLFNGAKKRYNLGKNELVLFCALLSVVDSETKQIELSNEELKELTAIGNNRTLVAAKTKLIECDMIKVVQTGKINHGRTIYEVKLLHYKRTPKK